MIKSLCLKNFQGYKKAKIKFAETGLNVIIGDNDCGKSSIARAIEYLGTNRPTRNNFISDFKNNLTMEIEGEFSDGTVTRIKSQSKNQYRLNDEEPFKALRAEVPEEIKDITRLEDVNIQSQDNPYFLLSMKPGQVAKEINKVADLEIMDKLNTNIKKELSSAKTDIAFWKDKHTEGMEEVHALRWTKEARKHFNILQKKDHALQEEKFRYDEACEITNSIIDIEEQMDVLTDIDAALKGIAKIEQVNKQYVTLQERMFFLTEQRKHVLSLTGRLTEYKCIPKATKELKTIEKLTAELNKTRVMYEKILLSCKLTEEYNQLCDEVGELQNDLDAMLKEAGICPLCGSKLD